MQLGEVGDAERMELAGDEVQTRAALRVGAPGRPGGEEVEPQAEADLQHHEAFALLPVLRQVVTSQKDVLCLFGATRCRVIDVVVELGARRAVRGDHQARGDDGHGSVRHGLAREQALDQADEEQHQRPYHQAHHAVERAGQERAGKAGEAGRQ